MFPTFVISALVERLLTDRCPFCPYSYAPTLLQWRAKRLRKETGDESIMTEQERLKRPLSEIAHETLLRPIVMLTTEPIMMCMAGYLSLIYGLLYGTFPFRHPFFRWTQADGCSGPNEQHSSLPTRYVSHP